MPARYQKQKDALLDQLKAHIEKTAPKLQRENLVAFADDFFRHTSLKDLREFSVDFLYHIMLSLWNFTEVRKNQSTLIRAYTPTEEAHGWSSPFTHIEVAVNNKPFVIDSITNELIRQNLPPQLIIHPILTVARDKSGKRQPMDSKVEAHEESTVLFMIARLRTPKQLREIEARIQSVLEDVGIAVEDWLPMQNQLKAARQELNLRGPKAFSDKNVELSLRFLDWLTDENFIFLGYREYIYSLKDTKNPVQPDHKTSLGVMREQAGRHLKTLIDAGAHSKEEKHFAENDKEVLLITKSSHRSTVHRSAFMDIVGVKKLDESGKVVGEYRFIGLYTSRAYSRSAQNIPILREKIDWVMHHAGYTRGSHNYKALIHIMETFPRDDLFQIEAPNLLDIAKGIVQLQERRKTAIFIREDRFDRYLSCLVYMPREVLSTQLRIRVEKMLEEEFEGGKITSQYITVTDSPLCRLDYVVGFKESIPQYDFERIEQRLAEICRVWGDRFREELYEYYQDDRAEKLFAKYDPRLSGAYRELIPPQQAVEDVMDMERLSPQQSMLARLSVVGHDRQRQLNLRIYNLDREIPISRILPMLENLALDVISEHTFEIRHPELNQSVFLHDFILNNPLDPSADFQDLKTRFEDAFYATWETHNENDGFNRLILFTPLDWTQIFILRAYARYLQQADFSLSTATLERALAKYAPLTMNLFDFFAARFDPKLSAKEREKTTAALEKEIMTGLDKISNPDEDRIIRTYVKLIKHTVRTNYYAKLERQNQSGFAVAFKLEAQELQFLPHPRPLYEIFVYSQKFEGVHLRGGKVARGGIRWSDRVDDFRTEVLGLVKAQMVKNAVIVPTGSKGGFVLKHQPSDMSRLEYGQACYRLYIRNLLSLTDNLDGDKIVPPQNVVRHDGDDPYLVVAADKGTATFSDLANSVSEEKDFWLGDAFASGGSNGYDHKKMAITARGAWVAVQRHFREMGLNTQTDPFTVIGVGDMSGDVFGNGMLRSDKIRLLAAFNHLHIFVDPDPDPALSFKERTRMFNLKSSTWADYDPKAMSAGGRIYERSAKSLKLTKEIQKTFDLSRDEITPAELIQHLLRFKVDLLWFGGIGTYIKASDESHADADDRSNNAVRVDASEVQAKVIGEGANLAVTQNARIEFALNGGRINTDAIDNSGGVDCSDHEVNIKILLNRLERRGELKRPERNKLLASMTDTVAELVLRDNYMQTQCISFFTSFRSQYLEVHGRFISYLEHIGLLNRRLERLPDEETLKDRMRERTGLTRPEYAVLMAYGKIFLKKQIVDSDFLSHRLLENDLTSYFPETIQKKYGTAILEHPLRRDIIATQLINRLVSRMGTSFVYAMHEASNSPFEEVIKAFIVADNLFDSEAAVRAIEALDYKIDAAVQTEMMNHVRMVMWDTIFWLLTKYDRQINLDETLTLLRPGVSEVRKTFGKLVHGQLREAYEKSLADLKAQNVPATLADDVTKSRMLGHLVDAIFVAANHKFNASLTTEIYFELGEKLGLRKLVNAARAMTVENDWQRRAVEMLVDEIYNTQAALTTDVMLRGKKLPKEKMLQQWFETNKPMIRPLEGMLHLLDNESLTLASLTVMSGQFRTFLDKLT